jgi:dGTPase
LIRDLVGLQVDDVLQTTMKNLDALQPKSPEDVQRHSQNVVLHNERMETLNRQLKDFLFQNMSYHYRVARMANRAQRFIEQIFTSYMEDPRQLPREYQAQIPERDKRRVVADYIAAMTDRGAVLEYRRLFDPLARP